MFNRGLLSAALVAAGLLGLQAPASAEEAGAFPSKPVSLIVPFQAGVSADLLFRGIAEAASRHLGQPVIVWREIPCALRIAGLCRDIERKAKLGIEVVKERLRCFPFDGEGKMVDLCGLLLAVPALAFPPLGPQIRVYSGSSYSAHGRVPDFA